MLFHSLRVSPSLSLSLCPAWSLSVRSPSLSISLFHCLSLSHLLSLRRSLFLSPSLCLSPYGSLSAPLCRSPSLARNTLALCSPVPLSISLSASLCPFYSTLCLPRCRLRSVAFSVSVSLALSVQLHPFSVTSLYFAFPPFVPLRLSLSLLPPHLLSHALSLTLYHSLPLSVSSSGFLPVPRFVPPSLSLSHSVFSLGSLCLAQRAKT